MKNNNVIFLKKRQGCNMPLDTEKTRKKIALILDALRDEPELIAEYGKIFRKEVPFFKRSWAAACFLMYCDKNERGHKGRQEYSHVKSDEPRNYLPEDESKRLFISVGKNRHIFPREILTLIISKASVPRQDIGNIRIMDNFSFVQVRDSQAQNIIDSLNGIFFRGRTLSVNYAKSRELENAEHEEDYEDKDDI
jgi:RNA recognition motif-containing protein